MREGNAPHARIPFELGKEKATGGKPAKGGEKSYDSPEILELEAAGGELRTEKEGNKDEESNKEGNFAEKARNFWIQKNEANRSATAGKKLAFQSELLGSDVLAFSDEEWNGAAAEWSWSLVGLVFGAKPSLGRMTGFVRTRWGDESVVSVGQLDQGIFLFSFVSELARDRVIDTGPWTFDNRPLVLKPWSPDEVYSLNSVDSIPVWVRFPRLGVHLRREDLLSKIASLVGKPLRTDGFTQGKQKLEYARVLVEIYAANEVKHSVTLRGPNGVSFVQKVEYDWIPNRCAHCQSFGHKVQNCTLPRIEVGVETEQEEGILIEPPIEVVAGVTESRRKEMMEEGEVGNQCSDVPEPSVGARRMEVRDDGEVGTQCSAIPGTSLTEVRGTSESQTKSGIEKRPENSVMDMDDPFVEIVKKKKNKRTKNLKSGESHIADWDEKLRTFARRSRGNGTGSKHASL